MKNNHLPLFVIAFSLTAFSSAGCAEKAKSPDATPPPAKTEVTAPETPVPPAPAPVVPPVTSMQWSDFKGYGFDMREQLFAGLKGLEAKVNEQIGELAAKRESLVNANISTTDWDLTMKEMSEARTSLMSTGDDLEKATRENWDQLKDRVGVSWTRTQDAYAKVKASTTK